MKKNINITNNNYNEMQIMKKINKEFDERCIKIRNRIQKIKKEEEEYKKKMMNYRKREKQEKLIKDDKKKIKIQLQRIKEEREKALQSKKLLIKSQKEKDKEYRAHKMSKNLSQKKINYQTSLNDKYLMKIIKEQLKTQQLNKNTYSHAKVRQELNEFETNKMKRNLEKENQIKQFHQNNLMQLKKLENEMKNTCNQLEELEKEALESLNKTKHMNMRLFGEKSFNYSIDGDKGRKLYKKTVNKSMENFNMNGIIENNCEDCEEEDSNQNLSVYVKRRRCMSPTNNKKSNNFNFNNKLKPKNSISINSFPKNIKAYNSQKMSKVDKNNKIKIAKNIQNIINNNVNKK